MYILKVKGSYSIPDFIQIRDDNFTLVAYFKASKPELGIKKGNLEAFKNEIIKAINEIPYGKISKI